MTRFYVYIHRNSITQEPFYVGKGSGKRAFERRDRSEKWRDAVRDLEKGGLTYSIDIIKIYDSEDEALLAEKSEILKYPNLVNIKENHKKTSKFNETCQEDLDHLGEKVRSARIEKNIQASDLANSLNINRKTLRNIEDGKLKGTSIVTVLRVVKYLGIQITLPPKSSS